VCRLHPGQVLPLPCFSIGIAPVAFGFSGGLVFSIAGGTVLLSLVACCLIGGIGCLLIKGRTLLIFELYPCALRLPFLSGRGYSHTLFLPSKTVRFRRCHCGAVGVKARSFCIRSGAPAIAEIVVFFVSHIRVPLGVSSF
jgi:hypothetical protein